MTETIDAQGDAVVAAVAQVQRYRAHFMPKRVRRPAVLRQGQQRAEVVGEASLCGCQAHIRQILPQAVEVAFATHGPRMETLTDGTNSADVVRASAVRVV